MFAYKSPLNHMRDRIKGYLNAMKANNLTDNICIEEIDYQDAGKTMDEGFKRMFSGLKKPDAVFFATNTLSILGLYHIKKAKLKVPEDIALIGFDGNEAFDFFYSPITCVKQPLTEMGKESVRILLDLINGSEKISNITLKHKLVIQKSGGLLD